MIEHPGSVVAFCGRRFGKGDAYVQRIYRNIVRVPGMYWWVGLSWRSASLKRAWRETTEIARLLLKGMGLQERHHINRSTFEIKLPGLGEIWFRTADNPASLAGEGIRGAVIDEFTLMPQLVWTEYIEGTLLDYGGWAAFSGVPKGVNWGSGLWSDAAQRAGWLQIHATSYENPYIDHAALEEVRKNTPDNMFRQEYLAEILEDGAVFRGVREAATAKRQEYKNHGHPSHPAHRYIMGVDLARLHDYTVITVIDTTIKEQCFIERFNQSSWTYQVQRIKDIVALFEAQEIRVDQTGVGDPIVEMLQREIAVGVVGVSLQIGNKAQMIEDLQLAFDRRELKILDDEIQISELQSLEATRLSTGIRYAASDGYHDDTVMALALAWDAAKDSQPMRIVKRGR